MEAQNLDRKADMVGGGDPNQGKCTIEVAVDGGAEIQVRGNTASMRDLGGQPPQWRRFQCTSAMPANPTNFRYVPVDGRGKQDLTQEPRNGGAAVVHIEDPQGGAGAYTFDLIWADQGGGQSFPGTQGRDYNNSQQQRRDQVQQGRDYNTGQPGRDYNTGQPAQGGLNRQDRYPAGNTSRISCSSDSGQRMYCDADTRGGVQLVRRLGRAGCQQGTSWGYDRRGIWVDRGCSAEFEVASFAYRGRERTVGAGASISIRTNETIDARNSDGRVFSGIVEQDVPDQNGSLAIPRGSNAELIFRNTPDGDLLLDLESVSVNGQRFAVASDAQRVAGQQRDGIGANQRTGEFIGGGALLGTIIGAIAGGGKGAAIGAAAGAGAGAGGQLLTRGRRVRIPAESVLTFRLEQPLMMGIADNGYTRGGRHYHYPETVNPNDRYDRRQQN